MDVPIKNQLSCFGGGLLDVNNPLCACDVFHDVTNWPDVNELFQKRSWEILANSGITGWLGSGGEVAVDGSLRFGAVSSPAIEIVESLRRIGRFRWTDDSGARWAVRLCKYPKPTAFAVSFRGYVAVLDARRRKRAADALRRQLIRHCRPGRLWMAEDREKHGMLLGAFRKLLLIEGAERILADLARKPRDAQTDTETVSIANLNVVVERVERLADGLTVLDPIDMLRAAMGFCFARVEMGRLGWDPRIVRQSSAITEIKAAENDLVWISVSPLLREVMLQFRRPVEPNGWGETLA